MAGKYVYIGVRITTVVSTKQLEINLPKVINNPADYLPPGLTQMDYIKSIMNMFNVYATVDELKKTVTYNLMDDMIQEDFTDYNSKVDYSQSIKKTYINQIFAKETTFTFLDEGEDRYNLMYHGDMPNENEDPGLEGSPSLFLFDTQNVFTTSKREIITSNIFSFNETQGIGSEYYDIQALRCEEENEVFDNFRNANESFIFSFYERTSLSSYFPLWKRNLSSGNTIYKAARYMNCSDNGASSTMISFGEPQRYYTTENTSRDTGFTYTTLYDYYWKDYVELMTDQNSYLYTITMYLTGSDYKNMKKNLKVRIGNSLYLINKISNFSPSKPTKLELIKLRVGSTK